MTHIARTCACCQRAIQADEIGRWACYLCTNRMVGWCNELVHQMVVLRASSIPETPAGPRVTRSRTAPMPGREDVLSLTGPGAPGDVRDPYGDQCGPLPIASVLGAWARLITEERRLAGPAGRTEEQLADWLRPHLDWAARQPWVTELHGELHGMMRAVRGITRVRPQRRPVRRPCPSCDALGVWEEDWQEDRWCTVCGGRFSRGDLALGAAAWAARKAAA